MIGADAHARVTAPRLTTLLSTILIGLIVLPLLIFGTNLPERGRTRVAREAALRREGTALVTDSARSERGRTSRARRRPTFVGAVFGVLFEFFWVCVAAIVGRKVFRLRL